MTLFVAALAAETNSFVPDLTRMEDFEALGIRRDENSPHDPGAISLMLTAIRQCAEKQGMPVVEGIGAVAQPGGPVEQATYEKLREELLDGLRAAMPVDAVLLILHGAMIAENCSDCEGDILSKVRAVVGPHVPVGAVLDLHGHLTNAMMKEADILVFFREYPHTDTAERAHAACALTLAACRGGIEPEMVMLPCRTVGLWPTGEPALAPFIATLREAEERDGVLSASFIHGFPWGDVADADSSILVIADGDPALARREAARLRQTFLELREKAALPVISYQHALDDLAPGCTVFGDMADNPGGGARGDSSFILKAVLDRALADVAIGCLFDPQSVDQCIAAGEGANIQLQVGGKSGPTSGPALAVEGRICAVTQHHGQTAFGIRHPMGRAAWVRLADNVDLVLISERQQTLSADAFTGLGIRLDNKRLIAVKSAQHYKAGFAGLQARCVGVDTPGVLRHDFADLPYRSRSLTYWPRIPDQEEHIV